MASSADTQTPPNPERVMVCPHCGLPSIQVVRGSATVLRDDPNDADSPDYEYTLLQCRDCREPSLQVEEALYPFASPESEVAKFVYPASHQLSDHIPASLRREFDEARSCFETKAYTATVVMVRRTLEGICRDNGIEDRNLASALVKMEQDGLIDRTIAHWAKHLRLLGNQGAHFTGRPISREDANDALTFTEALLDQIYVLMRRFDEFKQRRETKGSP
ncbi:DUF4145 domain-containing protein [Micromonospora sp. CPCC 205539]|uniref:DUF4145 domain-containing protein n=1 Tax=Micromonospora sp. CPCC 205539 TaxID=3122408 RepID=UPI002FF22076